MKKTHANYVPLSPLTFIRRTAEVYPDRTAVINGSQRFTWSETYSRCVKLASALHGRGITKGDTVAVIAPNVPALFEAHFGVPMSGAVLNALNVRLDADTIAYILQHSDTKLLISDIEFLPVISMALQALEKPPELIVIENELQKVTGTEDTYEALINEGDSGFEWSLPNDEWDSISINYTSGTTGRPKGVVYHHRGAYLNSVGNITAWALPHFPTYLWTLPMFHCNGWCFPWTITAMAGTHVCLRTINAASIFEALAQEKVTHICGAPVIMSMLLNAKDEEVRSFPDRVNMMTAGAAPPSTILKKMAVAGFDVTHTYGLTEVYGPVVSCAWHDDWDELPAEKQAWLKARQGVKTLALEELLVVDPETMQTVPADGETIGELVMRGNVVMKGYHKDAKATSEAFVGGYFHSGDLGVVHLDGYVEIKDRSKDIVISGGENISTIEVESVLYRHPAVLEAAVVAMPDDHWGERPCAFLVLNEGQVASEREIIDFCREHLAHFKCPERVIFSELPKTSTGKIQKFKLRQLAIQLLD